MYCNSQTPPTKRCTKIQVKFFLVDILLYFDQYYVPKAYVYHISPFILLLTLEIEKM